LEICRVNYDVIVVDSPPVLGISDASVISQEVDVTLLLIQHRRYPRNVSQRAKRVIEEVGGKLFGVILNNVNIKTDDNYYYYAGYSTQYGYKKRAPRARKKAVEEPKVVANSVPANGVQLDLAEDIAVAVSEPAPSEGIDDAVVPAPRVTYVRPPKDEDLF
jgi:Mrp family chromosome partitioning ATPase